MIQTYKTFQSQNLAVDYIAFKFQSSNQSTKAEVANYLFKLGFNSYQESRKLPIKQPILENTHNSFQVSFVLDNPYWDGILLHFSGSNAARFYFLSTQNLIDWTIFSFAILSRFDLYYSRENTLFDKITSTHFLTKLKQTTTNFILEQNTKGIILKIGNQRSNNCSRIYQISNSLRFELEMKGKILLNYHSLLIQNSFEEFEQQMSSHFILYFGKLLPLEYSYTDWLVQKLRPIRQQPIFPLTLNSDYIQSEIKTDPIKLIMLIQFINYAQDLNYQIKDLNGVLYRKVTFIVRDFIKFQNPTVSPTNHYQLQKTKDFLKELLTGALIDSFTSSYFQTLVAIPRVEFEIIPNQKQLVANVWLVEDLFYYDYPFCFPNLFQQKLTKDQFNVRFELFKIFNSIEIEKIILVNQFLKNYPSTLSNGQKTKIKQSFIELVQILKENNLIESNYKIIRNGQFHTVDQLMIDNISEGFVIYEKLII